ncbi:MAG: alpha/beta fold hydrolase [Promethearchaeota archaeon]
MYIDVNGIKINTVSFGSGEETFLGISGFVADWRVWMFVFEQLSTKMRCVGYDHRGSGESFAPSETISKKSYVNDLFSIMDKLGIEKCYLGGESFGGAVALLAALQQPERFKGLILIDTNLPNAKPIDEDRKQFINFMKSDHQGAIEAFIEGVMPEPNIEHMKRMGVYMCLRPNVDVAVRVLELVAEGETDYPLNDIKIPTLIVYGDKDGEHVIENSHYLEKILLDAELVVVKGAGHVPIVTRTQEVVDAIEKRFFTRK